MIISQLPELFVQRERALLGKARRHRGGVSLGLMQCFPIRGRGRCVGPA